MTNLCDFHSHILPNADHGSDSVEVSLKQIEFAKKYGITRILATPHFYPHADSLERFLARRDRAYKELISSLEDDSVEIKLGAEVLICPNLDRLPGLEKLCIGGTRTLLLELPFNDFGPEYVHTIEDLLRDNYDIILAHAERYPFSNIEELVALGVKIQVNASAVDRFFGNPKVNAWRKSKVLVALGSDIHGPDPVAYKKFKNAVNKLGEYALYMQSYTDEIWNS